MKRLRKLPDIYIVDYDAPSCRWPLPMLVVPVPLLDADAEVFVSLPRHMTERQWDQMMATLAVTKPALVK